MARKPANRIRREAENARYDDSRYGKPLFSLTYEQSELTLDKAASLWGPAHARDVALGVSVVCLLALILVLMGDKDALAPAAVLLALSVAGSALVSRWHDVQLHFMRRSNLATRGEDNRVHVVVTADAAYTEGPDDTTLELPLSELVSAVSDSEVCVADFGNGRYLYLPRSSMSENRFHALVRFLKEQR